jgi:hypothetical protein
MFMVAMVADQTGDPGMNVHGITEKVMMVPGLVFRTARGTLPAAARTGYGCVGVGLDGDVQAMFLV